MAANTQIKTMNTIKKNLIHPIGMTQLRDEQHRNTAFSKLRTLKPVTQGLLPCGWGSCYMF